MSWFQIYRYDHGIVMVINTLIYVPLMMTMTIRCLGHFLYFYFRNVQYVREEVWD